MNIGRYLRGEDMHVGTARITRRQTMIIELGEGMNEAGEQIPAYGFTDHKSGVFITDPYSSCCGRFAVDPVATYGLPKREADRLVALNKTIGAA